MQNSMSLIALSVAFVCFVQMAPGANALCSPEQLKEKANLICNLPPFVFIPCKAIVDQVLNVVNSICSGPDNGNPSTTTIKPTGAPPA